MPWTLYQSTDPGAPVLSGQAGALLDVLDACLVNGYGTKPAAGWGIAFSADNKRVYRPGPSAKARKYLRINDTGSLTGGTREVSVKGFHAMTDVDTGTTPFPDPSQVSLSENALFVRKSSSTGSTARLWRIFADDRTAILFADQTGANPPAFFSAYFGEFYSYTPNDAHGFCIIARQHENDTNTYRENLPSSVWSQVAATGGLRTSWLGHYLAGGISGLPSSVTFAKVGGVFGRFSSDANPGNPYDDILGGVASFPNAADGATLLAPFLMITSETGQFCLRGHLRGLHQFCHLSTGVNDGDIISGQGELAGRSFMLCKRVYTRSVNSGTGETWYMSGAIAVEISQPAATP